MKLALSSLKTVDYKQLAIDHGEKAVIALVGLMIATVLYGSNWKGTEKTPNELTEKADNARQQIEERPWAEKEEKEKAGLGQGNELAEKVAQLLTPVSASPFGIQPLNPPLHPDKTLISMPRWLPVQNLIADYGVAELMLKPGVPKLEEGLVPKVHKEKESKGKARAKRREQNASKKEKEKEKEKEKKEESEDAVPEDLRPKRAVGQAAGGGMGFGGRGGMMKRGSNRGERPDRSERRAKRRGKEEAEPMSPNPTVAVAEKPVGRGYRFVAVRGVFPLRDQVSELARAMGVATNEKNLQGYVQLKDFKLQRQTRIDRSGTEQWGPWESVDRDSVIQLLQNDVNAYAPETVLDGLLDAHICMPYPDRVVGNWDQLATHPDIKEFTLSEEDVAKQVEWEWRVIDKLKKENEKGKPAPDKGGFTTITKNMRALTTQAQGTQGDDRSLRDKIIAELESGNGDKDQMDEQLAEFVKNRATPVDHFILFRYLDLKVEPGKTYRYRVQLVVTNPFRDRRVEEVTDPSIIEGPERETEFSVPTPPVTVKEDAQFFVKRTDARAGRPSLPYAEMDIFQWFASTGTVVNKALQIPIGQLLAGRKMAEVLKPSEETFDTEQVPFSTKEALVDVSARFSLEPTLHKDIIDGLKNASAAKRANEPAAPDEALVVNENGELQVVDGIDQKADYEKTKTHYEQQNKPFEGLRKSNDDSDDDTKKHHTRRADKGKKGDPRRQFGYGRGRRN